MSWETCADLENFKFPIWTVLTADIPQSVYCIVLALALALGVQGRDESLSFDENYGRKNGQCQRRLSYSHR